MISLMKKFEELWPYHSCMPERYIVEDAGNCYRIIIKNYCDWQKKSGGCTMCNYSQHVDFHATDVIRDYSYAIRSKMKQFGKQYTRLKLYINGSFFNENELSKDIAISFLRELKNDFGVENICVETRPEFLSKQKLLDFIMQTGMCFEICFGIESTNDKIRNLCLNKGLNIDDFYALHKEIKSLCKTKVYLLIKPPFLTESEAIEDVITSVKELVGHGITTISYTPIAIQKNTLLEFLLQENLYRPVWIWSIIEINSQLSSLRADYPEIQLAGLEYYPEPLQSLFNCENCTSHLVALLKSNRNITWQDLSSVKICSCYEKWSYLIKNEKKQSIENQIKYAKEILVKNQTRSQVISRLIGGPSISYLTDVAKLVPKYSTTLDKVGVDGVHLPIFIHGYQVDGAVFSFALELDEFHRGIHMSRLIELLNTFSIKEHFDIIEDIKLLLEKQDSVNNSISFHCDLFKTVKRNPSERDNYISITLDCIIQHSCIPTTAWQKTITVSVPFINACPCTKTTAEELFEESYTHTQRGTIRVSFVDTELRFAQIMEFIENYIGIYDLLKREDEMFIVGNAHNNAQFCEDVCREITETIRSRFITPIGRAVIHVTTEESIHPHQAFSEKTIWFSGSIL